VQVEADRIIKLRGDRDNPKSQGNLCNKAARIPFYDRSERIQARRAIARPASF
jgi:hypothetical protein